MIPSYLVVYCAEIKSDGLTKDELIALTRDHFGRDDPDALLNGFFPVWAVIQFLIACKWSRYSLVRWNGTVLLLQVSFWWLPYLVSSATCWVVEHLLKSATSVTNKLVQNADEAVLFFSLFTFCASFFFDLLLSFFYSCSHQLYFKKHSKLSFRNHISVIVFSSIFFKRCLGKRQSSVYCTKCLVWLLFLENMLVLINVHQFLIALEEIWSLPIL